MKKILKIFTSDIKNILKNKIALIIVCGLLILPSLYAWFNIYASWDPYGNTSGIKIAVCNKDLGGKIKDNDINIGEELIENLKENNSLGWTFVDDPDEAISLTQTGEVYASIIIPKDFSEKMSTIIDDNPMKPSLEYYVNGKVNAISPKITDKGASTLQNQISSAFIESVTTQIFSMLKDAGLKTEDIDPVFDTYKKYLDHLIEDIPIMAQRLNANSKGVDSGSELVSLSSKDIDLVDNTLNDLVSFTHDFKTDIDTLNDNTDDVSRNLVETLNLTKIALEDLDSNTVKLKEKIVLEKPNIVDTLNESSANLKVIIEDMRSIQSSLNQFDKDISPEIESLSKITEDQLIELENLLKKLLTIDYNNNSVYKITKTIRELDANIRTNLLKLNDKLNLIIEKNSKIVNPRVDYITAITSDFDKIFDKNIPEDSNKPEIPNEKYKKAVIDEATKSSDIILKNIEALKIELSKNPSPLDDSLNTIIDNINKYPLGNDLKLPLESILDSMKKNLENIITDNDYKTSYEYLYNENNTLKVYGVLLKIPEDISESIDKALLVLDTIDDTCNSIDDDVNKFIHYFTYYTSNLKENVEDIRIHLNTINDLIGDEKNYLIPLVKEVTDISLSRMDEVSTLLSDLSNYINDNDYIENSLDKIHNLNSNMISNLDNLIIKINTDLTSTVKRYLSNASNFSSDANALLVSITDKTDLIKDFSTTAANNGQVAAADMIKISEELPELQEDLTHLSNRLDEFSEKANIEKFVDKIESNENVISDFMAAPVDLNSHSLYSTDFYGCSMAPFYTTLSLWVGIMVLSALLTTESKNVDFKPTPLQTYLGKYPLFATLAMIQGLIVALGDLYLLKVTAAEPMLFVLLSMFQSLVFCTIIYTLLSLFGNVGKAMGVVLLVLQVAGSGGTFPIQMTPPFFQKLYSWLPFTYGIGALREAVFGVLYPALRTDVLTLFSYFIVSFIVGALFVSLAHKPLEMIAHKLEESGIAE